MAQTLISGIDACRGRGIVVELYFSHVSWPDSIAAQMVKVMGSEAAVQRLVEYQYRDLSYSYDKTSDAQRAFRRILVDDFKGTFGQVLVYNEEVMPSHLFPCVNEVTDKRTIHRLTWRINNRMYLVVDLEKEEDGAIASYLYVRYQHADNVDLKKMDNDCEATMARVSKALRGATC